MHVCSECGTLVARVKMQDGREAEVLIFPIPYRTAQEQGREMITADGRRVNGASCFCGEAHGVAYLEHRHGAAC